MKKQKFRQPTLLEFCGDIDFETWEPPEYLRKALAHVMADGLVIQMGRVEVGRQLVLVPGRDAAQRIGDHLEESDEREESEEAAKWRSPDQG